MAEVLGLAGSIIAVIQIAESVIGACSRYISTAKDAQRDLRHILLEVSTLKAVLEVLDIDLRNTDDGIGLRDILDGDRGTLENCRRCLKELEGLFPKDSPCDPSGSSAKARRKLVNTLAWPLRRDKAVKLLEELAQHKSTLTLAMTTGSYLDTKEIKKSVLKLDDTLSHGERREFFKWLQKGDNDAHSFRDQWQKAREPSTCTWVLDTEQWRDWFVNRRAESRFLWINGIPGAGKTMLTTFIIDTLDKHCSEDRRKKAVAYYYCFYMHNRDEGEPFLRCVIGQLCRQLRCIPTVLYDAFRDDTHIPISILLDGLAECLTQLDEVFAVLDAVDESQPRDDLFHVLKTLATEKRFRKLRVVASSRCLRDIEVALVPISKPLPMKMSDVEKDIFQLVSSTLSKSEFSWWLPGLKEEVTMTLCQRADGMFRWVACQLDLLRRMTSPGQIRHCLDTLPRTLEEVYERILETLSEQQRALVLNTLAWIHISEVVDAYDEEFPVGILRYTSKFVLLDGLDITSDGDNFPNSDSVCAMCGCFIFLFKSKEQMCVKLAHRTVSEFLEPSFEAMIRHDRSLICAFIISLSKTAISILDGALPAGDSFDSYVRNVLDFTFAWNPEGVLSEPGIADCLWDYVNIKVRHSLGIPYPKEVDMRSSTYVPEMGDGSFQNQLVNYRKLVGLCIFESICGSCCHSFGMIAHCTMLDLASFLGPGAELSPAELEALAKWDSFRQNGVLAGCLPQAAGSSGRGISGLDLLYRIARPPTSYMDGNYLLLQLLVAHNHSQACSASYCILSEILEKLHDYYSDLWTVCACVAIARLDYYGLEVILRHAPRPLGQEWDDGKVVSGDDRDLYIEYHAELQSALHVSFFGDEVSETVSGTPAFFQRMAEEREFSAQELAARKRIEELLISFEASFREPEMGEEPVDEMVTEDEESEEEGVGEEEVEDYDAREDVWKKEVKEERTGQQDI